MVIHDPSNQNYVVPEFMVPALHQTYDGDQIKNDLNVLTASGCVSPVCNISDIWHLQYPASLIISISNNQHLQ